MIIEEFLVHMDMKGIPRDSLIIIIGGLAVSIGVKPLARTCTSSGTILRYIYKFDEVVKYLNPSEIIGKIHGWEVEEDWNFVYKNSDDKRTTIPFSFFKDDEIDSILSLAESYHRTCEISYQQSKVLLEEVMNVKELIYNKKQC